MLDLVRDHLAGSAGPGFAGLLRAGAARQAAGATGGVDALRSLALYHEVAWFPGGFGADAEPAVLAAVHADVDPAGADAGTLLAADLVRAAGGWRFLVLGSTRVTPQAGSGAARRTAGAAHGWLARAAAAGDPGPVAAGLLVAADLLRLGGLDDDAGTHLQQAYELFGDDPVGVGHCHLLVADSALTPWSSPELRGLDPWDHGRPPAPVDAAGARAATDACATADQAFARADARRGRAAVALRLCYLAAATGRPDEAVEHARRAAVLAAEAGDRALSLLADTHALLAAVELGRPGPLRVELPRAAGEWGTGAGSPSYARGLVRILRGSGVRMLAAGAVERARVALTVAAELADALGHRGEQAACLGATAELYGVLNTRGPTIGTLHRLLADRLGAAGAGDVESWMEAVSAVGALDGQYLAERHAEGQAWCARQAADLLRVGPSRPERDDVDLFVAVRRRLDALPELGRRRVTADGVAAPDGLTDEMTRTTALTLLDVVDQAAVRVPLTRALELRRDGFDAAADAAFDTAQRAAAGLGGRGRSLQVLVLLARRRPDDAARALSALRAEVPDYPVDIAADLLVAAHDYGTAAALVGDGAGTAWRTLLAPAEVALRTGDAAGATALLDTARADFERSFAGLRRDPFRVSVTDDTAARWLYLLAAEAALVTGDVERSLVLGDRLRSLPLLALFTEPDGGGAARRAWRRANAAWSAAFDLVAWTGVRTVAAPPTGDPALDLLDGDDAGPLLDRAQSAVEQAESALAGSAELPAPDEPDPGVLRGHLTADTVLLQYLLAGDRLIVWALTRDGVDATVTELDVDRLTGHAHRVHAACAGEFVLGDADASLRELGERLLDPVAEHLRRHRRVVVVPSGALHVLPFALLPRGDDVLGATHVVSVLPATALLPRLRRPPSGGDALVVGDPAFAPASRLPDLPGTRVEALRVARHHGVRALLGAEATEDAVTARLPTARLVHLATHGLLSRIAPTASALALSGTARLDVADLAGLRLDADLVVLSACDSGRGDTTLGGDVVGLARQLLAVGARAVLVSLWPVDDETTCLLMDRFHRLLAAGTPAADALAAAQRELRALGPDGRAPAYEDLCAAEGVPVGAPGTRRSAAGRTTIRTEREWAAFVLIGA